ncbi:MAG: hypothetical protein HC906_18510 [Bacteroidales bacterium]|nr:hypothetical protein [Bacteroidales bacterium]
MRLKKLDAEVKLFKKNVHDTVQQLAEEESVETGDFYVQLLDYLRETAHCMTFVSQHIYEHIDNNHSPLDNVEIQELKSLTKNLTLFMQTVIKSISNFETGTLDKVNISMQETMGLLNRMRKDHLKRIKSNSVSTRVSMLYMDIIFETKNLVLYALNLAKTSRDFAEYSKRMGKKSKMIY